MNFVPDRDRAKRDVRIAGDNRLAGRGSCRGEDPVVAAVSLVSVAARLTRHPLALSGAIGTGRQNRFAVLLTLQEGMVKGTVAEDSLHQIGNDDDWKAAREVPAKLARDGQAIDRRPGFRPVIQQVELYWQRVQAIADEG